RAENWPQWRGPRGDSTSQATGLPAAWNTTSKLAWKATLPGWGTSTPAVWDNAIFVTTQHDDDLLVLKLDGRDGAIQWTQTVGTASTPRTGPKRDKQVFHQLHNLASPSPVTDGEVVVVHFGNGDLAAYDFAGKQLWKRNLQDDYGAYTIWWGHANSPVLYGDLVISVCMQDSLEDLAATPAPSYLVAHDLTTGKERWKSARMTDAPAEQADAYTTPLLVEAAGREQLLVMGANHLDAYDPATGKQLWVMPGLVGGRTVTGPTAAGGMIYVTRGMRGTLLAARFDDDGKLTDDDVVWKYSQGTPDTPCPVVWRETLFTVTDDGIVRAFNALDGKLHWKERLKGDYKASPIAAEGRIYFLNTAGLCTVVSAAERFEKLSENLLPDTTLASPAVIGNKLLIRGQAALYCVGDKPIGERR
ncbi:MAG: PQQ-binding-like beta-propeller repeat protein, partial [Pirellulales bacterium]